MSSLQVTDCLQPELVMLERVNYFPRQLLTVDDMVTERDYFLQKLRRHNRYLHGWGVVCGLVVKAAPTIDTPWRVRIDGGYALGPYGDEIYVAKAVYLDLAKCGPKAMTDPCDPRRLRPARDGIGSQVYVAIKYAECLAKPVKAMPAGCGCEDDPCEYSRIRDSFAVTCLERLPASHERLPRPSLCDLLRTRVAPPCPPCPEDPWVVLARVTLPTSPEETLGDQAIENAEVRQLIASVAILQEQLIRCCCKGDRPDQPENPVASADLTIKHEAEPSGDPAGSMTVRYHIHVTNNGPDPATQVVVQAKHDPPFDNPRVTLAGATGWTPVGGNLANGISQNLGTLGVGASADLDYILRLKAGEPPFDVLQSTVHVSSATPEPNPSDNTHALTTQV